MTKGIRAFTSAVFAATLPMLAELGNTKFRRTVMDKAINEYGITVASASTHYNHAFKQQKETDPLSVAGLGRADDKKGGRKPKAAEAAVAPVEGAVEGEQVAAPVEGAVEAVAEPVAVEAVVEPAVVLVDVIKVKTGEVVAAGLTREVADQLIIKATAAKKAKLAIKADAPAETVAA